MRQVHYNIKSVPKLLFCFFVRLENFFYCVRSWLQNLTLPLAAPCTIR